MIIRSMDDDLSRLNKVIAKDGKSARWEGWAIKVFTPNPRAYYSPDGVFRDGQYGYERTIQPNSKGFWIS